MSLVLDASAALAWCFRDECTEAVEDVIMQVIETYAVVPALWFFETANGLVTAMRRRRCTAEQRQEAALALATLDIRIDAMSSAQAWTSVIELADQHELTAYDAAYLELARRRTLPLATLDKPLRAAAQRIGIPLLGV